jgi:hypothetical protein
MIEWLQSLPQSPFSWSMVIIPVVVAIAGLLVDKPGSASGSDRSTKHSDSRSDSPE